jgi:hypothetical protein
MRVGGWLLNLVWFGVSLIAYNLTFSWGKWWAFGTAGLMTGCAINLVRLTLRALCFPAPPRPPARPPRVVRRVILEGELAHPVRRVILEDETP